jgi:hypothetical protein
MHGYLGERNNPAFMVAHFYAGLLNQTLYLEKRTRSTASHSQVDAVIE